MKFRDKTSLLIVEDESSIRDMLRFGLEPANFEVMEAENVSIAKQKIALQIPDLILLDWMLPDISGVDFIKQLKQKPTTQDIPIIMLTARAEEASKVKGLEVGADDYITKPFSIRELIARIKTILRRGNSILTNNILRIKNLELDSNTHQVSINKETLTLTPLEYKLLLFFMKHSKKVYSREHIMMHIYGSLHQINDRTIDVLVRRLRNRLKPFGYDTLLQSVRGTGYQLTVSKE